MMVYWEKKDGKLHLFIDGSEKPAIVLSVEGTEALRRYLSKPCPCSSGWTYDRQMGHWAKTKEAV